MSVERFSREEFEQALTAVVGGLACDGKKVLYSSLGGIQGESCYALKVMGTNKRIVIRSSVKGSGLSAGTGEDSIRLRVQYSYKGQWRELSKQTWTQRTPGWEGRMQEKINSLYDLAIEDGKDRKGQNGTSKTLAALGLNVSTKVEGPRDEPEEPVSPKCPKCGSEMKLRTARRGPNAGNKFWGCSTFPRCRGTVDYGSEVKKEEEKIEAKPFTPSLYQEACREFLVNESGNAVIEAVAGSGKTTTIVWLLGFTPKDVDVAFVAFNRHIAKELAKRAPQHVHVSTLHSLGFGNIRDQFGRVNVEPNKVRRIVRDLAEGMSHSAYEAIRMNESAILRLVSLCKATLMDSSDTSLEYLCDRFGIETNGARDIIFSTTRKAFTRSKNQTHIIDYDDMIYFSAVGMVGCQKFDLLFVDECLPYKTPVLLANGDSLPIGKIVDGKKKVSVLAYNTETGKQEYCRVIGWSKTPNLKPMVKVRVKWSRHKGTNTPHNFVVCTTDHKIWTTEGYVDAGSLKPGMVVQVETSAEKSQAYKISSRGKESLSEEMERKNREGITGTYRTPLGSWTGIQGGNGRPMSAPQQFLLEKLGEGWTEEYAISTKRMGGRAEGYPTCYKVDIAHPDLQIAVEVDGESHRGRRNQDEKKDKCLQQLGWHIIRVSNQSVMREFDKVISRIESVVRWAASGDCPIDATVVSVEPTYTNESYVYDITVEGCHNFYANGILVHNCQDLNKSQIEMALKSVKEGGRIIAVGDRNQSIYGFRGADTEAIPNLIKATDATSLPLTITYRCPKSHVELAKRFVPEIEAAEWAEDGVIEYSYPQRKMLQNAKDGDLVLCRCNAPLVRPAFSLIREGRKAVILGRDIGKGLMVLVRKIEKKYQVHQLDDILYYMDEYKGQELTKLYARKKMARAQILEDKVSTIDALSEGCRTVRELEEKIDKVFSDDAAGVVFSSVHKAKGGEAESVYILNPELMPHPRAREGWEMKSERNLQYVAYTRSKKELYFVS
jgi:superfamily I DNA/RNA helicase